MNTDYENVRNWRKRTILRLKEAFGSKCCVCDYNKCLEALEFHHVDSTKKEFTISAWKNIANWQKLVLEVKKCVLLCANSHREVHSNILIVTNEMNTFDESYTHYKTPKIIKKDQCPGCEKLKFAHNKYCSRSCATTTKYKVPWEEINLKEMIMVENLSYSEIGRRLNISGVAVKKRAVKIGVIKLEGEKKESDFAMGLKLI